MCLSSIFYIQLTTSLFSSILPETHFYQHYFSKFQQQINRYCDSFLNYQLYKSYKIFFLCFIHFSALLILKFTYYLFFGAFFYYIFIYGFLRSSKSYFKIQLVFNKFRRLHTLFIKLLKQHNYIYKPFDQCSAKTTHNNINKKNLYLLEFYLLLSQFLLLLIIIQSIIVCKIHENYKYCLLAMLAPQVQSASDIEQTVYICLNKNCQFNKKRIFVQWHQHYTSQSCKKWLWKFKSKDQKKQSLISEKAGIDIDFYHYPCENINFLCKQGNNILGSINQFFQQKKKQLCNLISIVQANIQESIKFNISTCLEIKTQLNTIQQLWYSNKKTQVKLRVYEFLNQHLPKISSLKDMRVLDTEAMRQRILQIKKQIQHLSNDIIGQPQSHFSWLNIKEFDRMRDYLQQNGQVGKEIQSITKLTKTSPNEFLISQPNKIQAKYVCPITKCGVSAQFSQCSVKNSRKFACKKLIAHLLLYHDEELFYQYSQKISKTAKIQYSIPQLLDKIKYQNYDVIQLIDRASRFQYNDAYQFRTLTIQLVYKFKISQSNNPYLITTQLQIQVLVPILVFFGSIIHKKKIVIITQKKKFVQLCQIINSLNGNVCYKDPAQKQKKQMIQGETMYDEQTDELKKTEDIKQVQKKKNLQQWMNLLQN